MREPTFTPEVVERLLDRISEASVRISKDIEAQATMIDQRIKVLVDQGEKISRRLVETIDKDVRAQVVSLRSELEQMARRIVELRSPTQKKAAPSAAAVPEPMKKVVAKKVAIKSAPAKKAAVKPAAKKTAANKTAARKPVAKKTVRKLAA